MRKQVRLSLTPSEVERLDAVRGVVPRAAWVANTLDRVLALPRQGRELVPSHPGPQGERATERVSPWLSEQTYIRLAAVAGPVALGVQARELLLRAIDHGEDLPTPADPAPSRSRRSR